MSTDAQLERLATAAAEEVLAKIFGDDLQGCTVSLDTVSIIILGALVTQSGEDRALLELYDKAVEAIKLLATPPPNGGELTPEALQKLLSERLDTIRNLATKIGHTTAAARVVGNQ
jgi:hypothetical protein